MAYESHVVHIACTIRKFCASGESVCADHGLFGRTTVRSYLALHPSGVPDDIEYYDTDLGYRHAFTAYESLGAIVGNQILDTLGRGGFARRFLAAKSACTQQVFAEVASAASKPSNDVVCDTPELSDLQIKKASWRQQLREWRRR